MEANAYLIDFMFHGFPSENYDPGGGCKKSMNIIKNSMNIINFQSCVTTTQIGACICSAGARPLFFFFFFLQTAKNQTRRIRET